MSTNYYSLKSPIKSVQLVSDEVLTLNTGKQVSIINFDSADDKSDFIDLITGDLAACRFFAGEGEGTVLRLGVDTNLSDTVICENGKIMTLLDVDCNQIEFNQNFQ